MGRGTNRSQSYFNDSALRGRNDYPTRGKKSNGDKDQNMIFVDGVPVTRESIQEYDWTKSNIGKMMMAMYGKICWTYLCLTGKLPSQLKKENQLEKDVQEDNVEVSESA